MFTYQETEWLLLFMMVWFALDDGAGTIDLFGEDEAYHLMGEGHARKGYFLVAAVVHFF